MATNQNEDEYRSGMRNDRPGPDIGAASGREAMFVLRDTGKVRWNGGKPLGLRGVTARGKPVSETVIEDRR